MRWKPDLTDQQTRLLRSALTWAILVHSAAVALFSIWFTMTCLWHLHDYLRRVLFNSPW